MVPSVGKKLSFFVAVVALVAIGAVGFVSYHFIEAKFAEVLRKDTLDTASLLSTRIKNELRHVAEKGRILTAAALEEFKNSDDQIRFLEENLALDDQLLALSLYRKSTSTKNAEFKPLFRLTRPEGDPAHLEDEDFKLLDIKYPIDVVRASEGAVEVSMGALKDGTPVVRMAVPLVRKKNAGFTQVLGIEIRQERITAAFAEATAHFSFILDRDGRVLSQTDPTHFTLGEDLSHLPILQVARSTDAPNGNLDYFELPGGLLQYGSFQKIGYADLTLVTQASRGHVIKMLRHYTRQAGFLGMASISLALALALLASWGIIGSRLGKILESMQKLGDGKYDVKFPETQSEDEIGGFARKLQEVTDGLHAREKVHATYAKLRRSRSAKFLRESNQLKLEGERLRAIVVQASIVGLDGFSTEVDPEAAVRWMNKFIQQVVDTVELRQGIVDSLNPGQLTAVWGVPMADKEDFDRALTACFEIRKHVKSLNENFRKAKLSEVKIRIGVHSGMAVAGQFGTGDRLEYTVLGEASETATQLMLLTDQFGTDILLSGQAANQAPKWFSTVRVNEGDDNTLEVYELVSQLDRKKVEADENAARAADGVTKKKKAKKKALPPVVKAPVIAAIDDDLPSLPEEAPPAEETALEAVAEAEVAPETEVLSEAEPPAEKAEEFAAEMEALLTDEEDKAA